MQTKDLQAMVAEGIKALSEQLAAGNSEALTAYLGTMGKFHQYSFGNVMAIARQKPDATRVAGFQTWKDLGRFVRKGEKGIAILAPLIGKRKNDTEDGAETATACVYGFRGVYVFDVSQTDGEPLPEFAKASGEPGEAMVRLMAFAASMGIAVEFKPESEMGGAYGWSSGGKIALLDGRSDAETVTTFIHELGHELLEHAKRRSEVSKTRRELEAEAVSFVVGQSIGLDMNTASADYIRLYNGDAEMLAESMEAISRTASAILGAL